MDSGRIGQGELIGGEALLQDHLAVPGDVDAAGDVAVDPDPGPVIGIIDQARPAAQPDVNGGGRGDGGDPRQSDVDVPLRRHTAGQ